MTRVVENLTGNNNLKTASSVLRALAHPLRIKMIEFIREFEPVNVNEIYRQLKMEQSVASQQLKILRDEKLVNTTRKGKFIFYSLNRGKLRHVLQAIYNFTGA